MVHHKIPRTKLRGIFLLLVFRKAAVAGETPMPKKSLLLEVDSFLLLFFTKMQLAAHSILPVTIPL